jgi:peroxiredoxin
MKKIVLAAIAFGFLVTACHYTPKNANPGGFTIVGHVKGMDSGWIYFAHTDSNGYVQDSAHIKGYQFTYMGKVAEPSLYYFWLKHEGDDMARRADFFVEDTVIEMKVDKDSLQKTEITGSPVEDQYMQYKKALNPIMSKKLALDKSYVEAAQKENKVAIDSIEKQYEQIENDEHQLILNYIEKNPSSVVGAWSVVRNFLYDSDVKTLEKIYSEFTPDVQKSQFAKTIKKQLDIEEHLQVGMVAPDLTENDTTGKPVSLSSFRGKYLLVDFWASWCGPCRRENPNVLAAYKKYKDKNFTILGVSLDESKQAWEKAINDDGLVWNHISDLKGWKNQAAAQYGIRGIPSNYLLDPDGKILGHNLRGEDLEKTLASVIK